MELRLTFDSAPAIYDRARPTYPPPLFDELFAYARDGLPFDAPSILEIAPGTGKATGSLLERGARVTAVEIGPNLARFLREKFPSESLDVINSAFEDADLPAASFDIIACATAFGWIDPDVRLTKVQALLRPGGTIAVINTNQVRSDIDRGFFERVFPIYQRHRPGEPHTDSPDENVVPPELEELRSSGLFEHVDLRRYRWDQTYPTAAYADLVRSYSNSLAMEPDAMEALIADLSHVIDTEYGGSVTRPLVITLTLGRKSA